MNDFSATHSLHLTFPDISCLFLIRLQLCNYNQFFVSRENFQTVTFSRICHSPKLRWSKSLSCCHLLHPTQVHILLSFNVNPKKCFPSSLFKLYNNHPLLFQVLCPPLYTTVLCPLCTSNLYFSVTITFLYTNFITYFLTCFQNFLPNTSFPIIFIKHFLTKCLP